MPEMPEVETIKRGLSKELIGHRILSVDVRVPKLFIGETNDVANQEVQEIARRAKILIWKLEDKFLVMHLKMTGQLIFVPNSKKEEMVIGGHPDKAYGFDLPHKHTHIIFAFDNGTLYFNDLRKFGWVKVVESMEEIQALAVLYGPEYDWPEFTLEYFIHKLAKRGAVTIKQALLDQSVVAGLGNIYADESLFCAGINPKRKVKTLTEAEVRTVFECLPKVLNLSLKHGGTSSQHYRKSDGSKGTYLTVANVYRRENEPCKVCGTPIERTKIAGRSSHYCPECQT